MDHPARRGRSLPMPMPRHSRAAAGLCLVLGIAVLALAGTRLADGLAERSLDERLAAAPASPALWLEKAERDADPKALRLSVLTGPREPALEPRQRALADRLGPRVDPDTRALLK
jgi:hypothetical protein